MSTPLQPHYVGPLGEIIYDFAGNVLIGAGDTPPTDGTAGYAVGALWFDTDGADGSQWLRNDGTASSCDFNTITGGIDLAGLTATLAELNKLDDSAAILTEGSGVSAAETYASGVFRNGDLIVTRIVVDLTDLVGSATDLDIIGDTGGAANAHFGQITAALNGTIVGGKVTCLEVPAGGADDIDFYSSDVGTGAQDVIITDAALGTETALVTSGAAWTSGATKGMTGLPAADDYLYIVNGEAAAGGTFTAGKFLIELYGTP